MLLSVQRTVDDRAVIYISLSEDLRTEEPIGAEFTQT